MERVTGIGGFFFKCKNPKKLQSWYAKHLGVPVDASGFVVFDAARGDQTIWAPFPRDTRYFRPSRSGWMLNLRVKNLDRMLAQLRRGKCDVDANTLTSELGRFAWVMDPEGNRVELWEPPKPKRSR